VKYPEIYNAATNKGSKFTYEEDSELFSWIKNGVENRDQCPLEAQLADWADQMIYSVNDIEDATRAGLLNFVDMRTRAQEISNDAEASLAKDAAKLGRTLILRPDITGEEAIVRLAQKLEEKYAKPKSLRERKANLKAWTSETIKFLKDRCKIVSSANGERSVRYKYRLEVDPDARALVAVLKSVAYILVFLDPRVLTLEDKGRHIIDFLFDKFCSNISLLPLDFQELINAPGQKFGSKERLVADFIAGMTDSYAYGYYKRLMHPGIGSFYEDV
jgi:dGTPase